MCTHIALVLCVLKGFARNIKKERQSSFLLLAIMCACLSSYVYLFAIQEVSI